MNQLKTISNKQFLQELKFRAEKKKISEEGVFNTIISKKPEIIRDFCF
ncbi:MAG: hypothetical protein MRERC_1c091 [Mycoplasmataceae bacterium RC_NB112A]|nr:MAG: hypothetical protein MRERC_1c091 [Mycoplasmataceae bacterium RC_NB112A]